MFILHNSQSTNKFLSDELCKMITHNLAWKLNKLCWERRLDIKNRII